VLATWTDEAPNDMELSIVLDPHLDALEVG